jgi:parallel beta-helix repeat protein
MATSLSNLQTAKATTTIYILADGSVSPVTAPIQRNEDLYTLTGNINSDVDGIIIERNNTILDGAGYTIQGTKTPVSRGIYLSGNYHVTIRNINIRNFESGVLLDAYSTYNTISGNKLEGNDYGISCWAYSDSNSIIGNNISTNNLAGIWIVGSSDIAITENIILGNSQYGISLESSSNDIVHHNSFISNANQVYIYDSNGTWDNGYPSGGNYWSDYTGADAHSGPNQDQPGSDGIWDSPYNCSENNQDGYPLMQKWTNIAIMTISSPKTALVQGQETNITVTLQNQGWDVVTTEVTLYANTTILTSFTNVALLGRQQANLNFTWQTATFEKAQYVLSAKANAASGEPDTRDNTLIYGKKVAITVAGDVNGDGSVDIYDAIALANAYSATPTSLNWNGNADINGDNIVDIYDAITLSNNYGKKIQ